MDIEIKFKYWTCVIKNINTLSKFFNKFEKYEDENSNLGSSKAQPERKADPNVLYRAGDQLEYSELEDKKVEEDEHPSTKTVRTLLSEFQKINLLNLQIKI